MEHVLCARACASKYFSDLIYIFAVALEVGTVLPVFQVSRTETSEGSDLPMDSRPLSRLV